MTQKDCDQWNERHPIGTEVIYRAVLTRPGVRTRTRSLAHLTLGCDYGVIFVEGVSGFVHFGHIEVVKESASMLLVRTAEKLGKQLASVKAERDRLRRGLEESIKLQSHYAGLLNAQDGGLRMQWKNADEWLSRVAYLDGLKAKVEKNRGWK